MRRKLSRAVLFCVSVLFALSFTVSCESSGTSGKTTAAGSGTAKVSTAAAAKTTAKSSGAVSSGSAGASVTAKTSSASSGTPVSGSGSDTAENDTGSDSSNTSDGDDSEGDTADNSGNGDVVSESKSYDLKGREIKLMASQLNLKESQARPFEDPANQLSTLRYKLMMEAEKKFNCKFVFDLVNTSVTVTKQKFDSEVMAGVTKYDGYRLQPAQLFPSYEKNNVLLALNDYIDFSQPIWDRYYVKQATGLIDPSKVYGLQETQVSSIYAIWYNTDILARNNIPNISEIKAAGQWNWPTFIDIALRTTQDSDGDGIIDQWGLVSPNAYTTGLAFLWSNQEPIIAYKNGSYIYNLGTVNGMKSIQLVSDLYNTYRIIPNKNGETDFRNYKAAMCIQAAWYGLTWKTYNMTNIRFDEMPFGPDNDGTINIKNWAGAQYYFFPASLANDKDAEGILNAFAYWHILWDESKEYHMEYPDMVMEYGKNYMFDTDFQVYVNVNNRKDVEEGISYFTPTQARLTAEVFNKIATVQTTAASAIESLRSEVESIIAAAMAR